MFREVIQRHDKVLIIGGGESLIGFDWSLLNKWNGVIVTVNNVIKHIPRADYWITVDPTKGGVVQDNMSNRKEGCYYFACYPQITDENREWYPTEEGIHYLERIVPEKPEEGIGDFSLQEDRDKITTGDSCYGALGLAYHFEAKLIVMLGVDANGGYGHWYDTSDPYNKGWKGKFAKYQENIPKIYRQSVEQFKKRGTVVINGSPLSSIDCFDKMTPEEAIQYGITR